MNSLASTAHHRNLGPTKPTAKAKAKRPNRPPVKVVYISNPMRVTTSASRFRALVQRLTGRDSRFTPDPTAYEVEGCCGGGDVTGNVSVGAPVGGDDDDDVAVVTENNKSAEGSLSTTSSCEEMGGYDGDEFLMVGDFPDLGSEGLLALDIDELRLIN